VESPSGHYQQSRSFGTGNIKFNVKNYIMASLLGYTNVNGLSILVNGSGSVTGSLIGGATGPAMLGYTALNELLTGSNTIQYITSNPDLSGS
jgi:hypothetical protein